MTPQGDKLSARLAANRFRLERDALMAQLSRLLGRATSTPLDDAPHASALLAEFREAHAVAEPNDWAFIRHEWPMDAEADVAKRCHLLGRNLGVRTVWLLVGDHTPQAVTLRSDIVLDNPLGFAGIADHQLCLFDGEVTAGLWLARHSHHFGAEVQFTWELDVFGEPWLSAAARALRGVE
jgi:hypothetical protein